MTCTCLHSTTLDAAPREGDTWVLESTNQRTVPSHAVSHDRHVIHVNRSVGLEHAGELVGDVVIHVIALVRELLLGGVHIEPGTCIHPPSALPERLITHQSRSPSCRPRRRRDSLVLRGERDEIRRCHQRMRGRCTRAGVWAADCDSCVDRRLESPGLLHEIVVGAGEPREPHD